MVSSVFVLSIRAKYSHAGHHFCLRRCKMARRPLFALFILVFSAVGIAFVSCSRERSHRHPAVVILETSGKRSGAGEVTVEVRDAYRRTPIEGAYVWIGDGASNVRRTDARGMTTFADVPSGPFRITAGATGTATVPPYSLQTFDRVDAHRIRFALKPVPASSDHYVRVSGTIANCTGGETVTIRALSYRLGYHDQYQEVHVPAGATTFNYTIHVMKGYPFHLVAYETKSTPNGWYISKLDIKPVAPVYSDSFLLDFHLQPLAVTTGGGSISQCSNYHTFGANFVTFCDALNPLFLANAAGALTAPGPITYDATYPLMTDTFVMIAHGPGTAAAAWEAFLPSSVLPPIDVSALRLNTLFASTSLSGTGVRPTVSWLGGPLATEGDGFYYLDMEYRTVFGRWPDTRSIRSWTVFLSDDATGFTFPEVPAALAGQGFVTGDEHRITLNARLLPGFDFDQGDFTPWIYFPMPGRMAFTAPWLSYKPQ
jgi:hypothetical protein